MNIFITRNGQRLGPYTVPNKEQKILKSVGIDVGSKLHHKPNERREMNDLLKKMGARKLTREDRRRFRSHLTATK
jgi:hypothetical protein